jgi:hypothetical protein
MCVLIPPLACVATLMGEYATTPRGTAVPTRVDERSEARSNRTRHVGARWLRHTAMQCSAEIRQRLLRGWMRGRKPGSLPLDPAFFSPWVGSEARQRRLQNTFGVVAEDSATANLSFRCVATMASVERCKTRTLTVGLSGRTPFPPVSRSRRCRLADNGRAVADGVVVLKAETVRAPAP